MSERLREFAVNLYKINAIKFGDYKLKIGIVSPIYCDLRVIISYPQMLDELADLIVDKIQSLSEYKLLCGVPYTALPIATALSLKTNIPMILKRKEAKSYGTGQLIEGHYQPGDTCLIIEDVVSSGSSVLETTKELKLAGIKVTETFVVLNREQGGEKNLNKNSITLHSLFTISSLIKILVEEKCIDGSVAESVNSYIKGTQVDNLEVAQINRLYMSFDQRISHSKNAVTSKLFGIICEKQTNLCAALDLCLCSDILSLADQVGPHVCIVKLHADIITDFTKKFVDDLKNLAARHNFMIMEDRKFADIGNTVSLQVQKGIHNISDWADLITVHSLPGKGIIQALEPALVNKAVFLIAEMSNAHNLFTESYTASTVKLADDFGRVVAGLVCQNPHFLNAPGLLQLTPGIQLNKGVDNLDQLYNSPEFVVLHRGADIGVVGRGITEAGNPVLAAEQFKTLLWDAYLKRIRNPK